MNYFKIFINLHDVDEKGPMYLYSKSDTKKFIKNNFIDRNNYVKMSKN